jgi:mono/diheme cytochrome c family protein
MRHTSTIDNEVAMPAIRVALAIFAVVAAGAAQSRPAHPAPATPKAVTFSEDIAPILYQHCVTCHRPGEVAPFPLITFEDAVKRGKSLVKVTESRVMPPWHAAHGYGEFADERRLTDAQIATIRDWFDHGMPRGDAAKMPPLPAFTEGWQLGTPDLILEMPEAFEVPASGPDVYRNFVMPTGLTEDRWVRAIEYRPGTRTVVHHSLFQYIRGGAAAKLANADGSPGTAARCRWRSCPDSRRRGNSAPGRSVRRRARCPTVSPSRCRRDPISSCNCTCIRSASPNASDRGSGSTSPPPPRRSASARWACPGSSGCCPASTFRRARGTSPSTAR